MVAGQLTLSAGDRIPAGWLEANGQVLPESTYPELYAALGRSFGGGDGTFALPDLQGRAPLHMGQGTGPSDRGFGAKGGTEAVVLTIAEVPPHDHSLSGGAATAPRGDGQPHENLQPWFALRFGIRTTGTYLPGDGGDFLGRIVPFARATLPDGFAPTDGQLLPIAANTALFALFGTTFGGDGASTFGLPDLRGRVAVGTDPSLGWPFGERRGAERVALAVSHLPAHVHGLETSGTTGATGDGAAHENVQPSMALSYLMRITGAYPSTDGAPVHDFLGEVALAASDWTPEGGWMSLEGHLLQISQNQALFSIMGTTYGGNGRTNFAVPDLRGRVPLHAGYGSGLAPRLLGTQGGASSVTLTEAQVPAHVHEVADTDAAGHCTGPDVPYSGSQLR